MGDPEINEWMEKMVQKTKDSIEDYDYADDTTSEARKLLESWSIQTESFCPEPGTRAKTKVSTKPKVAVYRKLDTPMMVAKKIETDRPSVDPTLIMEARRQHIKEMKAQRLERQAAKQLQIPQKKIQKIGLPPKVALPDIEGDVKGYKERIAQRTAEKIKELEEKQRQSIQIRAIEESAQQTIAKEEKKQIKQQKKLEKKSKEINEQQMKQQLQLLYKTLRIRAIRRYYSLWASRCSFRSQAYKRAAAFNDFQNLSQTFSFWKSRFHRRRHERELDQLEARLRHEKQMEEQANNFYMKKNLHKYFVKWSAKYKMAVEYRIIEEQHKKRRALLINKIEEKIEQQNEENQQEKAEKAESSPPRKSLIPKSKPKPLKVDPRIAAMEKRAEEQRKKKLEKAAKEAQIAETAEEEKAKQILEEQRKKRQEHMQFLEQEKKKREEQQKMQEEFERQLQRKKYIQTASKEFRLRRLKLNAFVSWAKILVIQDINEEKAMRHREDKLMSYSLTALAMNKKEHEDIRNARALAFYNEKITRMSFLGWLHLRNVTAMKEYNARKVSNRVLLKTTLHAIILEKRRRQKAKFMEIVGKMNKAILRRCFRAWPEGCAAVRDDERRAKDREDLMAKALQMFDELSDDDF